MCFVLQKRSALLTGKKLSPGQLETKGVSGAIGNNAAFQLQKALFFCFCHTSTAWRTIHNVTSLVLDAIPDKAGNCVGIINRIVISTVNVYIYDFFLLSLIMSKCVSILKQGFLSKPHNYLPAERNYVKICCYFNARVSEQTPQRPSCRAELCQNMLLF